MNRIYALKTLPKDDRDLRVGALFKLAPLTEIPDEFTVAEPLVIKDQMQTDECSAYASTAVSEDQEGIELSPEYQFYKSKQLEGKLLDWGCDLRSTATSFTKFGSIEKGQAPLDVWDKREKIVGLEGKYWTDKHDKLALAHKKETYVVIDTSKHDFFDSIRLALWKFRNEKRTIFSGIMWCHEWLNPEGGIIEKNGTALGGHAFKIFGWKQINGKPYLKIQQSYGESYGQKGILYMSREVANLAQDYGAFMFVDEDPAKMKKYQEMGLKADSLAIVKLYYIFLDYFKKIFNE